MKLYFDWEILLPTLLSLLYGWISFRYLADSKYRRQKTIRNTATLLLLVLLWSVVNIPLPIFYTLFFIQEILPNKIRGNKAYVYNTVNLFAVAVHMLIIGLLSFFMSVPMYLLLQNPHWRILSVSAALIIFCLSDCFKQRLAMPLTVLQSQAGSEEIKPFIRFHCFCTVFLLMDSVLCLLPSSWKYLPLLLIGSMVLLLFFVVRLLLHIYSILKVNYLAEEHRLLKEELLRRTKMAQALKNQSSVDYLTQIFSRRYLFDKMAALLKEGIPFSLAYIDLDKLKRINDQEGHQAGDQFIIQFTTLFQEKLRSDDVFARIGGDEFAVLMIRCMEGSARLRMEKIRMEISRTHCLGYSISYSYGIAFVPKNTEETLEQIIDRADQAMYEDKKRIQGRG